MSQQSEHILRAGQEHDLLPKMHADEIEPYEGAETAAPEMPQAMRQSWKGFNPYNLDDDVDPTSLHVVNLGDIRQHVTDNAQSHNNIIEAMHAMRTASPTHIPPRLG